MVVCLCLCVCVCVCLQHELTRNNACWCARPVWLRTNCISDKQAVLSPGCCPVLQLVCILQPGQRKMSPEGFPMWEGQWGRMTTCQFTGNILVAMDTPLGERATLIECLRWDMRLGAPLMSPGCSYQGYLPSTVTRVLKNGLPWTQTWLGQLM